MLTNLNGAVLPRPQYGSNISEVALLQTHPSVYFIVPYIFNWYHNLHMDTELLEAVVLGIQYSTMKLTETVVSLL